jgi:chemotaxis protein CheD
MSPTERHDGEPAQQVFLLPGTLHCAAEPTVVATILGSCVAVCLWDSARRIGGMNHFLLPRSIGNEADERYGDFAIERLVAGMRILGSRIDDLRAKLFGGANVLPFGPASVTVGAQNVEAASQLMRRHRIPVVARRVGGRSGLRIWQDTRSGAVAVRMISRCADGCSHAEQCSGAC